MRERLVPSYRVTIPIVTDGPAWSLVRELTFLSSLSEAMTSKTTMSNSIFSGLNCAMAEDSVLGLGPIGVLGSRPF